jgi:HEPN domain-containing protein
MKEEVKRWLEQAKRDLITAENSFESKDYYASSFWCQQAAEKALKALLIKKTGEFPKIHDLTNLARLNMVPQRIVELCAKLNPAYTNSRYPGVEGEC